MIRILFLLMPLWINAQSSFDTFFDEADALFGKRVHLGKIDYQVLKNDVALSNLMGQIQHINLTALDDNARKAFLINVYNLGVISQVVENYPIGSVQEISGFFDRKFITLNGKDVSLNYIEKELLLKKYKDPRLHFALVCGAVSCAPLKSEAYQADSIEEELDKQTESALANNQILSQLGNTVYVSQLFDWYAKDFGGKEKIVTYLNDQKADSKFINEDVTLKFLPYNWSLNDSNPLTRSNGANANRYVVSSTIPEDQWEIKWFNNLYHQKIENNASQDHESYFTSSVSLLYGLTKRWNVGLSTRYRRVRKLSGSTGPFEVFSDAPSGVVRQGLTALGPQIRVAPIRGWNNFSVQSAFVFPIGADLAGGNGETFIDWAGPSWYNQFFNDYSLGDNFSLFTELDFIWEEIGSEKTNQISTPATVILSYFPIKNMTIYGLTSYAPYWGADGRYYHQYGMGFKYQFSSHYELELLLTNFNDSILSNNNGSAATYNVGMRASIF